MDRRRFLVGTIGASSVSLASPWLGGGAAATDDELAFANFGASVEYLVKDFYERAIAAKVTTRTGVDLLRRGRSAAAQHAKALSELLTRAGDVAPVEEDFAFEWPARTFGSARSIASTGTIVLRALLGAYQTAAASVSEPSYRILFASLAASVGQQIGALATLAPRAAVEPFPVAMDLEAASGALDRYLG